jgi:hypothetical protein
MKPLLPHIVIWAVLTTIVVFLAIYRRKINSRTDESLHVLDAEASIIPTQADVAKKLAVVDRWGKTLTVIAVLYLLGIAAAYIYMAFQDQSIKLG